jgi:type IV secretion system protein TrbL
MLAPGSILTAPFKLIGGLLGGIVGSAAGDVITVIAKAIMQSLNQAIATVATLWVRVGTPNLTTTDSGSTPSDPVAYIQGHLWWYMTALAICGVLVGSARMAWEQRAEPGHDVMRALGIYVAVAGAGLGAIALCVSAADQFSSWIIAQSVHGGFGVELTAMLGLTAASSGFGAILVIVLGLLALLASLLQIFLMVVRGGMLVILAGILPTTAAFTSTQAGRQWFRKSVSWLIAFILYKPAAAIVYATAFRLASSNVFGAGGLLSVITGLSLMMLALLALPALMRFVTPMVGAIATGGASAMLAAGAGVAAMAMPTGALRSFAGGIGGVSGAGGNGPGGSDDGQGPRGADGTPGLGGGGMGSSGWQPPDAAASGGDRVVGVPGAASAGASAGSAAVRSGGVAAAIAAVSTVRQAADGTSGAAGVSGEGGPGGSEGVS